jgi:hypothetical protein
MRHAAAGASKAATVSATSRAAATTAAASGSAGAVSTSPASTVAARAPAQPAGPSPGSLPQTETFPSANTLLFRTLMADLWSGVVHDSVSQALPAFFPEGAYVQLKSIGGAASDWTNRLVGDYGLDIGAAHALLGSGASSARLLGVHVVSSYGHWVPPGVCDNGIGYYELPNARVVYSEGGATRSFGIASLISWRGVWYVVHLGAILRPGESGEVDEPASGPGVSAYSGTC